MYYFDFILGNPLCIVFAILLGVAVIGATVMQYIENEKQQEELDEYYSDIYEAITGDEW